MQPPAPILFLPKGGLGNQLIQCAHLALLADLFEEKRELLVSSLFYQPWLNRSLRWQPRNLCRPVLEYVGCPLRETSIIPLLRYWPRIRLLYDLTHHSIDSAIFSHRFRATMFIASGYCHHPLVFDKSNMYWKNMADSLSSRIADRGKHVFACHFRFGDYLTTKNRAIYASQSVSEVLQRCLDRCDVTHNNMKISVFTDDPARFTNLCPTHLAKYIQLHSPRSAFEDFISLAAHQIIFASNSTFSLAAGRISSLLYGKASTILPPTWFVDPRRNASELAKWSRLDYIIKDSV